MIKIVKYCDLIKVKTYEQRKEISRLESEIEQIKAETVASFFPNGSKVFYYDILDDENVEGIVIATTKGNNVKVEINKVDGYEVEKYYRIFRPDVLCKGEY